MAASGSRGQQQFPSTEGIVTVWEKRLADAASVFRPFNASLVGSEVEKQTRSKDRNRLLPNRPKGTGILVDASRLPTLDLTTGLGKFAGRPASSLPQVLNGAQQRAPAALEGQHAEAMNVVMQVLKEGEESDAVMSRNLVLSRKRREDLLRVALSKINEGMETTSRLSRERTGFPDVVNSWKQEMILQKQKHDRILTELQDEHDKTVTDLQDEHKNSEKLIVQKYEKIVKDMEEAPRRKAEATILLQTHERIVTVLQDQCKEAETALIQQHERTIADMIDARKEEEAAQLIRKSEEIVTRMQEDRKEAETALTQRHERVVTEMKEERKKSETLLVQKHDGIVKGIREARKVSETLLIQKHEMVVMEMRDVHEADRRLIQKYETMIADFELQESRKKADQVMLIHNHKKKLCAQADSHRREEAMLNHKHGKAVKEMQADHKEAEKLLIQNYEKVIVDADEARKEREVRLLKDYKAEMDAVKEREMEILLKQSESEAEVVTFKNMYHMALKSYSVLLKEHGEAKEAMQAQLESLQCQFAALKEDERTGEKEHTEEVKRAMDAVPKSPESQLSTYKYTFKTRAKKDLELVALQSELAELQNDKVELQKEMDALRDHQDREIKSKADKISIALLWEVAQKVLSFPEDLKESQITNTPKYETLLSSRKENSVDKMMDCVTAALKTAVTNWKLAQDDFAKLKLASRKHVARTIRDIAGDSNDSENESDEEVPQKKRTRLFCLTELKERRLSNQQQAHPSRRKRTTPKMFVPTP